MKKLAKTLLLSGFTTVIIILSSVSVFASPGGSNVEPSSFSHKIYSSSEDVDKSAS